MLKKYYMKFHSNKYITKFSNLVGTKNLWDFNREAIAKGLGLGVACSWIPLPFHTMIAVGLALLLDCNIPLVAASIWFANPITIPFMYYFAYELGLKLLNLKPIPETLHLDFADIVLLLHHIWQPFLLGCLVAGILSGLLCYLLLHLIWPVINSSFKDYN